MTNLKRVHTLEIAEGDVVVTHGMRVKVSNRTERQSYCGPYYGLKTVVHFDGLVLNPEEIDKNFISEGMRTNPNKREFKRGTYWAIQGNDLAHWHIEQ